MRLILLGCVAGLAMTPAIAQSEPETLDPVIVTGTRLPTPVDQVGRAVTVIDADDIIERQQRSIFDVLAAAPGVQTNRSGSFGGLSSVSLRGLPSDQTLVVQDGVVLNNPAFFGNTFDFANFDTSDIQQIEVLRGAQSTLYGSDAIGGVINIVTRDGRQGSGGTFFLEGGSFGTFRGATSIRTGGERYSGRVTLSGVTTDGFSAADEADGNTEADGFRNLTVSSRLRAAPVDGFEFTGLIRYSDSANEFDGFAPPTFAFGDTGDNGDTDDLTISGQVTYTSPNGGLESFVRISHFDSDLVNRDGDGNIIFEADGTRTTYEYQATLRPVDTLAVVAGFEFEEESSGVAAGLGSALETDTTSYFALVQYTPTDFISLNGGVRVDNNDTFGAETTFSVSGNVGLPGTGLSLRGSYAEGFQAPTAGEQDFNTAQTGSFVFDPALDLFLTPETSRGWDIGVDYTGLGGRLALQATYFDQQVDDLIDFQFVPGAPNFGVFVNVDLLDTRGVELSGRVRLIDGIDLTASYTFTDAVETTTDFLGAPAFVGVNGIPEHRASVDIAWQALERLSLAATITYNGAENVGTFTELDDFTLLTLRGSFEVTEFVDLFVRIDNATDADFQDVSGFGTAPISAFGGIRAKF